MFAIYIVSCSLKNKKYQHLGDYGHPFFFYYYCLIIQAVQDINVLSL